jgi:hypothetical protein
MASIIHTTTEPTGALVPNSEYVVKLADGTAYTFYTNAAGARVQATQGAHHDVPFVLFVDKGGSDLSSGRQDVNSKLTIQAALDVRTIQGTAINVRSGSYNEAITITGTVPNMALFGERSSTTAPITFINQTVTISGADMTRVRMGNLGITGLTTVVGTQGRHTFEKCVFGGGFALTQGTTNWLIFEDCTFTGPVTIPNTFAGYIIFNRCDMSNVGPSLSNISGQQLILSDCSNVHSVWFNGKATLTGRIGAADGSFQTYLGSNAFIGNFPIATRTYVDGAVTAAAGNVTICLTIAERNALAAPAQGAEVWVADATGDNTVTAGWAMYMRRNTTWIKTQEEETLNAAGGGGIAGVTVVADIGARNALTPTQGQLVWVINATGDLTVASGAAKYLRNNNAWVKVAEVESMDLAVNVLDLRTGGNGDRFTIEFDAIFGGWVARDRRSSNFSIRGLDVNAAVVSHLTTTAQRFYFGAREFAGQTQTSGGFSGNYDSGFAFAAENDAPLNINRTGDTTARHGAVMRVTHAGSWDGRGVYSHANHVGLGRQAHVAAVSNTAIEPLDATGAPVAGVTLGTLAAPYVGVNLASNAIVRAGQMDYMLTRVRPNVQQYGSELYILPVGESVCRYFFNNAANTTSYVNALGQTVSCSTFWDQVTNRFNPKLAGMWQITASYKNSRGGHPAEMTMKHNGNYAIASGFGPPAGDQQISHQQRFNGTTDFLQVFVYSFNSSGTNIQQVPPNTVFNATWLGT